MTQSQINKRIYDAAQRKLAEAAQERRLFIRNGCAVPAKVEREYFAAKDKLAALKA